jgi:hypothetical protein
VQPAGEGPQRRIGGPADHGERVERQQDRHHHEGDAAADQRVHEPGPGLAGGRGQGGDQDRRRRGLDDQRRPATGRGRQQHGEQHDHADLNRSRPDQQDDPVAQADPGGHPDHQLAGAP